MPATESIVSRIGGGRASGAPREQSVLHGSLALVILASLLGVLLLASPKTARAQYVDDFFDRIGLRNELSLGGSVGTVGEFYSASGISNRRPTASGRLFARAQASGYGLNYGLNMRLTTEQFQLDQNFRRQPINQIDLSVRGEWMEVRVGNVAPRLSEYSLRGVALRGGYLELTPGQWRFTYTGGVAQRAVEPDPIVGVDDDPATGAAGPSPRLNTGLGTYQRWVHSARIGYGERDGNHVDLIGLYGYDDASSLDEPGDLAPASNANVSTVAGARFWDDRVRLQGQVTASALTNDTRAPLLGDTPGFLYDLGLAEARLGSQMNYAGRLRALVDLDRGELQVSYERIQPGFRSVGLAQLRTDQEIIRMRPRVQFLEGDLQLSGELSQNRGNLAGDPRSTLRRRQKSLNARMRFSDALFVSARASELVNETIGEIFVEDVPEFMQTTRTLSLSPSLTLTGEALTHSIALTANAQRLSYRRSQTVGQAASFENYSSTLSYTLGLASGTSLGLTGNALVSRRGNTDLLTTSLNANAGRNFLDRALRVNLSSGWSRNRLEVDPLGIVMPGPEGGRRDVTQQLRASSNLIYRVPVMGDVSLRVRALRSSRPSGDVFNELQSTLRYEYNF